MPAAQSVLFGCLLTHWTSRCCQSPFDYHKLQSTRGSVTGRTHIAWSRWPHDESYHAAQLQASRHFNVGGTPMGRPPLSPTTAVPPWLTDWRLKLALSNQVSSPLTSSNAIQLQRRFVHIESALVRIEDETTTAVPSWMTDWRLKLAPSDQVGIRLSSRIPINPQYEGDLAELTSLGFLGIKLHVHAARAASSKPHLEAQSNEAWSSSSQILRQTDSSHCRVR